MTSPRPELEVILRRLERLEAESRESRFWGRWGPLIYLVIGAAIPLGLGVDSITRSLSLAQPAFSPRVEAEEFVLKDADGQVRAKLVMGEKSPRLTFYDAEGNPHESLSAERVSMSKTRAAKDLPRFDHSRTSSVDQSVSSQVESGQEAPSAGSSIISISAPPAPSPAVQSLPVTQPASATGGSQLVAIQSNSLAAVPVATRSRRPQISPGPTRNRAAGQELPATSSNPQPAPGRSPVQLPAAPVPAPMPSAAPVPTPAIPTPKLIVMGYVEKPGVGREVVVSAGVEVYVTHQGETFAERFKVLKITPTTVDLFDSYTNQNLQLGFSP